MAECEHTAINNAEPWKQKVDCTLLHAHHDHQVNRANFATAHSLLKTVFKEAWGDRGFKIPVIIEYEENADRKGLVIDEDIVINGAPRGQTHRTAYLPVSKLETLANDPRVKRIHPTYKLKPLNDEASKMVFVQEPKRQQISTSNHGAGVVVGIVDTGIDYTHPMFEGRVAFVWDQNVEGSGWSKNSYGQVYAVNPDQSRGELPLDEYRGDEGDGEERTPHGTHVAGSAAGKHEIYGGMAPEATIVLVSTNWGNDSLVTGTDFIFSMAKRLGNLPVVINMSLGGHGGPHDGTDPLDIALSQRVGPGKLLCAAAGNEGQSQIHASGDLESGVPFPVTFVQLQEGRGYRISVYVTKKSSLSFRMGGREFSPSTSSSGTVTLRNVARITYSFDDSHPTLSALQFTGTPLTSRQRTVNFELISSENATFHSYVWLGDALFDDSSAKFSHLVGSPGSAAKAITVAALYSRVKYETEADLPGEITNHGGIVGERTGFSSPGPLLPSAANPQKPDCAAPGSMLISALSAQGPPQRAEFIPKGSKGLLLMEGTSMATPVVTGLVALLLAENKTLTAEQAKEALVKGNNTPWNPLVGNGPVHLSRS